MIEDATLSERILEILPPALAFIPLTGRADEIWMDIGELAGEIMTAMAAQAGKSKKGGAAGEDAAQ